MWRLNLNEFLIVNVCVLPYSLQPCMHTFCAACYSGWMERSSFCPTCRCPVERIRKNHILNNLVEAYLLQHPGTVLNFYSVLNASLQGKKLVISPNSRTNLWIFVAFFFFFWYQRSVGVKMTCVAWMPGTRSHRTCCSQKSSAPSRTRRAVQTIYLSSRIMTATFLTWGQHLYTVIHSEPCVFVKRKCLSYLCNIFHFK